MSDLFEQMGGGLLEHEKDRYDNSRWAEQYPEEEDAPAIMDRERRSFTDVAAVARKMPKASISQNREWMAAIARGQAIDATPREKRAGARAEREIVAGNLGLVWHFGRRFIDMGVPTDELMAAGRAGLARALATFDPEKGALSTHARFWIEEECRLALDNSHALHVTDHGHKALAEIREARHTLLVVGQREPRPEEIAVYLDWPVSKVNSLLLATEGVTSTDAPASEGGGAFHDLFSADSADRAWVSSKYRPKKGETWQPETLPGLNEEPTELLYRSSAVENGDFPTPRRKMSDRQRWEAQCRDRHHYTPAHLAHLQRRSP